MRFSRVGLFLVLLSLSSCLWAADYEPGVVLVKFKPGMRSMANLSVMGSPLTIQTVIKSPGIHTSDSDAITYVMSYDSQADAKAVADQLLSRSDVALAEPNYYVKAAEASTSDDPHYYIQTYLNQTDLPEMEGVTKKGSVIVAVIDSGVDYTHPDLDGQLLTNSTETANGKDDDGNGYVDDVWGYDFYGFSKNQKSADPMDRFGHGTHISGIIAAKARNGIGIRGINPSARILPVKFLNDQGTGTQADAAQAIYYAVSRGAKILNCSWGYFLYDSVLKEAIQYAISKGCVVVAAAGNANTSTKDFPAGFPGVVAVSSVDNEFHRSSFSNWGNHIMFCAPGNAIYSLGLNRGYGYKSGTSQSTAIVSAMSAYVLGVNSELKSDEVTAVLQKSCVDLYDTGKDVYTGHGYVGGRRLSNLLNYYVQTGKIDLAFSHSTAFEQKIIQGSNGTGTQGSSVQAAALQVNRAMNFPNPFNRDSGTFFGFETSSSVHGSIRIYSLSGQLVRKLTFTGTGPYVKTNWDARDEAGQIVAQGTYLYVIEISDSVSMIVRKGKLTVLG